MVIIFLLFWIFFSCCLLPCRKKMSLSCCIFRNEYVLLFDLHKFSLCVSKFLRYSYYLFDPLIALFHSTILFLLQNNCQWAPLYSVLFLHTVWNTELLLLVGSITEMFTALNSVNVNHPQGFLQTSWHIDINIIHIISWFQVCENKFIKPVRFFDPNLFNSYQNMNPKSFSVWCRPTYHPAVLCPFHPPDPFLYVWCLQSVREQDVRALILVPTKELGQQVQTMIRQLTAYCSRDVRVADISGKADLSAQRSVCSGTSVTHLYIYILLIKTVFVKWY